MPVEEPFRHNKCNKKQRRKESHQELVPHLLRNTMARNLQCWESATLHQNQKFLPQGSHLVLGKNVGSSFNERFGRLTESMPTSFMESGVPILKSTHKRRRWVCCVHTQSDATCRTQQLHAPHGHLKNKTFSSPSSLFSIFFFLEEVKNIVISFVWNLVLVIFTSKLNLQPGILSFWDNQGKLCRVLHKA